MRKHIEQIAFVLLIIGTTGLLLNEFVFTWGRCCTLVFAAANAVGLTCLAVSHLSRR